MIDFSFTEKLFQLKEIIISSPFFFVSLFFGIVLLIVMIIGIKRRRRINKIIFIASWVFVAIFCIIKYNSSLISILDRLFGRIVEEIYFPSISIYTITLLITNILFIYSIFNKKISNDLKIINLTFPMIIDFLFILILDTIVKSNIDIYEKLNTYSNSKLLVLLEFSMMVFIIWLLILSIVILINKYAVKKVFLNNFKESDYEVIDSNDDSDIEEKIEIDDGDELIDIDDNSNNKDDSEIVDL